MCVLYFFKFYETLFENYILYEKVTSIKIIINLLITSDLSLIFYYCLFPVRVLHNRIGMFGPLGLEKNTYQLSYLQFVEASD